MKKSNELFDQENIARKYIEFSSRALPETKIGEIWRYYVGLNIGQEISKGSPYLRPCIILQKFKDSSLIIIAPLTTSFPKKKRKFIKIQNYNKYNLKKSWISMKNIGPIDKKRLIKKKSPILISKIFCKNVLLSLSKGD